MLNNYKTKNEQLQVELKKISEELNAQMELNRWQQNTIDDTLRKNKVEIRKVREELEAQCQFEREEANDKIVFTVCLQAVAKQLYAQQEHNMKQLTIIERKNCKEIKH